MKNTELDAAVILAENGWTGGKSSPRHAIRSLLLGALIGLAVLGAIAGLIALT